jgi:hypothetical protein
MIAREGIKTRAIALLLAGSLAALGQEPVIEPRMRPQPKTENSGRAGCGSTQPSY